VLHSTVSHYRILERLGSGGMGVVYRAEDLTLGREVALKFISDDITADPLAVERFKREARAAAAISHPNICTVYEIGEHGHVPYLSMELLEGQTLAHRLTAHPLPLDIVLDWAIQIADALEAAHSRGIVHRDLKPANLFLTKRGQLKILDFGLAKLKTPASARPAPATPADSTVVMLQTDPGRAIGTPAYMSPEQVRGEPVDARSDLFSLGVVLYHLSTGRLPFEGGDVASIMAAILRDRPASPADLNPALPPALEPILTKALEKDPPRRYQSAAEMRADLEQLRQQYSVHPSTGPKRRARRPVLSRPILWISAAAALLLCCALGSYFLFRPRQTFFDHPEIAQLTTNGDADIAAISPDGRYVAYAAGDGKTSLRLRQVSTDSDIELLPPANLVYNSLAFSPDNAYIYYSTGPGYQGPANLFRIPIVGGSPRPLLHNLVCGASCNVAFSPDGKRMAFFRRDTGSNQNALVLAALDGTEQHALRKGKDIFGLLAFHPNGNLLATSIPGTRISLIPVDGGQETSLGPDEWSTIESIAWLRDGSALFVAGWSPRRWRLMQIWALSYPQGRVRPVTRDSSGFYSLSLTANSEILTAVRGTLTVNLWAADAGALGANWNLSQVRRLTSGTASVGAGSTGLSWLGERTLFYAVLGNQSQDIYSLDLDHPRPAQITRDEMIPAFCVCGNYIVFNSLSHGHQGGLWRIDLNGENRTPLARDVRLESCSVDGQSAEYSVPGDPPRFFQIPVQGGAPAAIIRQPPDGIPSPDKHSIAYRLPSRSPGAGSPLAVVAVADRRRVTELNVPDNALWGWAPDSAAIDFVSGDQTNLFRIPLTTQTPEPLTHFDSESIFAFAWSRSGKMLALARGVLPRDVVLIRNTQSK
jgi:serine/threonine protein kinase